MTHKVLESLHGKKAIGVAIGFLTVSFLFKEGLIGPNLQWYLDSVLMVLAGVADIATTRFTGIVRK